MISALFRYQTELALPSLKRRVKELRERSNFRIENEKKLDDSFAVLQSVGQLHAERRALLQDPEVILPFLQPGRLVKVLAHDILDVEKYVVCPFYSLCPSLSLPLTHPPPFLSEK